MMRATTTVAVALAAAAGLLLGGCSVQERERGEDGESGERARPAAQEREEEGEPAETPTARTTEPAQEVVLARGDDSAQVRELQARLAQFGHFTARPTGYYGDVTFGAVSEYQRDAGLEVSGTVYESTWAALTAETTEPTQEELYPQTPVIDYGEDSAQVRELQARLAQLGHFTQNPTGYYGDVTAAAVTSYQEAAGLEATGTVYEDTWAALRAVTTEPAEEEMYPELNVPEAQPAHELDDRCLTGRALCVSKTSNTLSWVIDGDVRMTMDVRFGAEETPTREGEFEVYWKSRNHHSTLYDSPMPYAMFFDGGQAVHYSEDFAANGYNGASHGCVNVRDEAAIAELYDQVKVGDKVIVYW